MNICERIRRYVERVFKTTLEIFLEALRLSPNAQGYVSGSITELLLKKYLEENGFEVKRIKEKWEGKKHPQHHGDFYFRKLGTTYWYVIEVKGLKSNSEKWHKLYNFQNLKNFLIMHADKIPWIDRNQNIESQVTEWIYRNLPKFAYEYSSNLYEFEEIQSYVSKRKTEKAITIERLRNYTRDQINNMIEERINYVMSKLKVLETHFVSGTSGVSERKQATPRKDEFNIIAVDIVLRYPEHRFVFANPKALESSIDDPDHIQQNYIIGFVFFDENGNEVLHITEDWYESIEEVYDSLNPADAVDENDMQVDNRYMMLSEEEI